MNYTEALDYIHSLGKFGSKPGLERVSKLLELLGNPERNLKIIHVAGTNGKGSVSTMIASILSESGMKVALYTSPFVECFNERIKLSGKNISDCDLASYTETVLKKANEVFSESHPITEFEFITALAFKYYFDKKADVVVLEVGLGGRLDATNVIEAPLASVITKIDLDHTGILGETIEQITFEKCGIIKNNSVVVTTSENKDSVLEIIKSTAEDKNSAVFLNSEGSGDIISSGIMGTFFVYKGKRYSLSMPGIHQVDNALTAIKTVETVFPNVDYGEIFRGLEKAKLPARCEVMSVYPLVLLDGSHNPNGTSALKKFLESSDINEAVAVVGFMADKDVKDALKNVIGHFKKVYTVTVSSNPRSMSAEELAVICKELGVDSESASDYEDALKKAKTHNGPIVVFGSLYLAGDIRPILKNDKK